MLHPIIIHNKCTTSSNDFQNRDTLFMLLADLFISFDFDSTPMLQPQILTLIHCLDIAASVASPDFQFSQRGSSPTCLGAPLEIQSKEGISCNRPYPRLWNIKAITLGLRSLTKTTCVQCFFPQFPVCIWLLGLNNWREAGWRW